MQELTFNELPSAVTLLLEKLENIERLLLEKSNLPQQETDKFLNIKQAGELLHLSVPTIYGLTHRAEIPVCKRGKKLYFSKLELTNWVKSGRKKTLSETASEAEAFLLNKKKR